MNEQHRFAAHLVLISAILILTIVIAILSMSKNDNSNISVTHNLIQQRSKTTSVTTQPIQLQTWFTTSHSFFGDGGGAALFSMSSTQTTIPMTTLFAENCPFNSQWLNDGFCDDETNIEDCLFDGGDCCSLQIKDRFCDHCICHETGIKHQTTAPPFQTTLHLPNTDYTDSCLDHRIPMIGDGYCDDVTNVFDCDYDGGDCCVEEPNLEYCFICTCKQNVVINGGYINCHFTFLGDMFCDDENNNPKCGYDQGDCCGPSVDTTYCTDCTCYQEV